MSDWKVTTLRPELAEPLKSPPAFGPIDPAPISQSSQTWIGANWSELHTRALSFAGTDDTLWLARFSERVPCGSCRIHWAEFLRSSPPRWADYFAWSVEAHNAVNKRLNKPCMTVAEARQRWATGAQTTA
jgi:hypothetical protein